MWFHYRRDYCSDQQLSAYYEIADKIGLRCCSQLRPWIASSLSLLGALWTGATRRARRTRSPHRRLTMTLRPFHCTCESPFSSDSRQWQVVTHLLPSLTCCINAQQLLETPSTKWRAPNEYCLPFAYTFGSLITRDEHFVDNVNFSIIYLLFHLSLGRSTTVQWSGWVDWWTTACTFIDCISLSKQFALWLSQHWPFHGQHVRPVSVVHGRQWGTMAQLWAGSPVARHLQLQWQHQRTFVQSRLSSI